MKNPLFLLLTLLLTQKISAQQPTVSIHLNGESSIIQSVNQTFVDPGYTATDSASNDYSANVIVTGAVNTAILGMYQLQYAISPAIANAAPVTRVVTVVDTIAPVITRLGPSVIKSSSKTFIEPGLRAMDNYYTEQTLLPLVTITSTSNVKVDGNHYTLLDNDVGCIFYHLTDPSGNEADSVVRCLQPYFIGIEETISPLFALYPTPAHNTVYIQSELQLDNCLLINLSGKIYPLFPEKTASGYTLNISSLDEGIYLLMLESKGQRHHSKLVIAHHR